MNAYASRFAASVILALASHAASPQNVTPPTPHITSEGEAAVSVMPSFADFWFLAEREGEVILNAANEAIEFREAVQTALADRTPKPLAIEPSSVNIPSIAGKIATAAVRVRFPIIQNTTEEERVRAFATLCDDLAAMTSTLRCKLAGPELGVAEVEEPEQQAVSRATENALYKADAIAALLQSQIYAVQSVDIIETQWLTTPSDSTDYPPGVSNITCKGRVRVVYLISPLP